MKFGKQIEHNLIIDNSNSGVSDSPQAQATVQSCTYVYAYNIWVWNFSLQFEFSKKTCFSKLNSLSDFHQNWLGTSSGHANKSCLINPNILE